MFGTPFYISAAFSVLALVLEFFIGLFWSSFLLFRIFRYRSEYNKLVSRWSYNPAEFNIDVFNLKVKIVIYTFLLLIIFNELLGSLSYCLGLSSFNLGYLGPEIAPFPLNITLDCYPKFGYIWEFELAYPVFTFLMILGDVSTCMMCFLMIALLKFVFLAYQLKTNFRSVKLFLIKSCTVLLFLFIISIIPQTQVFSKIITPILCITIIYLLFKHRAGYFHILRKRCNDTFGDHDHKIHLRTKRNSIITFNISLTAIPIMLFAIITNKLLAFAFMVFTEKSRVLTAVYYLDINLSFFPCDYQQIIYEIQYLVAIIQPIIIGITIALYLIPQYAIVFVFIGRYLYRQCRGIDSRYIRFEGNAHLYHRVRY